MDFDKEMFLLGRYEATDYKENWVTQYMYAKLNRYDQLTSEVSDDVCSLMTELKELNLNGLQGKRTYEY